MRAYTSIVDARRAELTGSPDSGCPTGISSWLGWVKFLGDGVFDAFQKVYVRLLYS